ncbi:unnamed protein product [Paramecium primaurelia]|uniref:Uncharacterized protein n=2 Tax=Paramecium TaxID=5884 RepID=A0A8S1YH45_9CILI|nr:unnamed protein product [Paramecium primaurelia]CAD8212037.1 unnamed protein product [Paramecium pentaurelia]
MVSAYSVGNGKRSNEVQQGPDTPGPGQYSGDKKQKYTPPSFKIPQAQRQTFQPSFTPGPGAYASSDNLLKGPKFSFAGKKQQSVTSFQPGPGAYNLKPTKQTPQYSFGGKYGSHPDDQQPGPGEYQLSKQLDAPTMRFPRSKRDDPHQEKVPGPGTYKQERPESAPKYRFGNAQRRGLYDNELGKVPGPGQYNYSSQFESVQPKGFTLVSRKEQITQQLVVPGPGAYDPQPVKRPPSCKIGKSMRGLQFANPNPGPGEYEPQIDTIRPQSAMVRVGSATRRPLNDVKGVPGPGTYDLPSKMVEGPQVKILGHKYDPVQAQKDQVPGPGQYERPIMQRPQSAKIGTSRRQDLNSTLEVPGPGQYKPKDKLGGPCWGFGTGKRPPLNPKNDTPGPGGYDQGNEFGSLPKYAMKKIP